MDLLEPPGPLNSAERQVSTTSMTPLTSTHPDTENVAVPKITTVIPIREEFRCRRAWFFYHDIRAFVTSWATIPFLVIWRLLAATYIFIWLILHIVARRDEFGVRWLIYITDLAYLMLTIGFIAIAALTVWYAVIYYGFPDKIKQYTPQPMDDPRQIYSQDNIPWFAKLCWLLYLMGASLAPLVMAGYWILVYRPVCPPSTTDMDEMMDEMMGVNATFEDSNTTNVTFMTPPTGGNIVCGSDLDVYSLHLHGVNVIIILIDLFVSRIPYQFMHFFYPFFFMIPYVLFTIIYWGAGGTNPVDEMRYIYEPLEYSNASAFGWAFFLLIADLPAFFVLFLFAWLRDVIGKHVSCCYRDIEVTGYDVNEKTIKNGTGEPDTKV